MPLASVIVSFQRGSDGDRLQGRRHVVDVDEVARTLGIALDHDRPSRRARRRRTARSPRSRPPIATWPGPKTDVSRTTVARAGCIRQASSPRRFESA